MARQDSLRPARQLYRGIASFSRDAQGAAAVEFAFVAVPFFGFVLLILQVGLYHFGMQSLDFAVRQAGRSVMTGRLVEASLTADEFKSAHVCPKVFFAIDCGKLVVNSFRVGKTSDPKASSGVYSHFDAATKTLNSPDPTQKAFCLGGPGDYIYLDVAYPFPNFMKRLLSETATDTWMMRSSTVVFNEPKARNFGGSC